MAGWTVVPTQDTSAWTPVQSAPSVPAPVAAPPSPWYSQLNSMAGDATEGVMKGLGSTLNNIGHIVYPDWLAKHLTGAPSAQQQDSYFKPADTMQSIGKGAEQLGEWFVPGLGEEAATADAIKAAPKLAPLARIAFNTGTSAALNTAQGGSPVAGAIMGGVGSGLGEGLKALAPGIAEGAMGIRKTDRAYNRRPGIAVFEETTALNPGKIVKQGQATSDALTKQKESLVNAASQPIPMVVPPPSGPRIAGFLPPPVEETLLHSSPDIGGDLSRPITLNAPDRPMPLQLGAPRNIASETPLIEIPGSDPLMSPMAFDAEKFPQRNIVGGVGPQALRDLGSTANTIPSRLTRDAFMSGSEHPELSGQIPVSQGILRRFEEPLTSEVSGMGPGQYIGEIPGDRGGIGQPQGVLRRMPDMSSSTIPDGNPLFPPAQPTTVMQPNNIASLAPARQIVADTMAKAKAQNAAKTLAQLTPLSDSLSKWSGSGEDIPENVSPRQLLDLLRGVRNDHVSTWNPDISSAVTDAAKAASHSMADQLHTLVPGTQEIDDRLTNLIPVIQRSASTDLNAGVGQSIAHRVAAHTGALTGAAFGAREGYEKHGILGGLGGAALGLALPELLTTPTAEMGAARLMYSPTTGNILRPLIGGSALSLLDRDNQ